MQLLQRTELSPSVMSQNEFIYIVLPTRHNINRGVCRFGPKFTHFADASGARCERATIHKFMSTLNHK